MYVVGERGMGSKELGRMPQFWGLATQNPPEGQLGKLSWPAESRPRHCGPLVSLCLTL